MVGIGEDMGIERETGVHWVIERISEAYMTTDGQCWVDITLVEKPAPAQEQKRE